MRVAGRMARRATPQRLIFVLWLAVGCTSVNCARPEGGALLEVWHADGGFAPVISSIAVFPDGRVLYDPPRGRVCCRRISEEELERVRVLSRDGDFRDAVGEADAAATGWGELEAISVEVEGFSAHLPLERAPAELRELLELLEGVLQRRFRMQAPWGRL